MYSWELKHQSCFRLRFSNIELLEGGNVHHVTVCSTSQLLRWLTKILLLDTVGTYMKSSQITEKTIHSKKLAISQLDHVDYKPTVNSFYSLDIRLNDAFSSGLSRKASLSSVINLSESCSLFSNSPPDYNSLVTVTQQSAKLFNRTIKRRKRKRLTSFFAWYKDYWVILK